MGNRIVNINHHIARLLIAFFLITGFSFVVQMSNAPAASANSCSSAVPCLSTAISLAVHGVSGGGGNIGGGIPAPGGGSASTPPPISQRCWSWTVNGKVVKFCGPAYKATTTWLPYSEAYKDKVRTGGSSVCPPKNVGGFVLAPEGRIQVDVNILLYIDQNGVKVWSGPASSFTCVYPPGPNTSATNIRCIVGYSAYFDRNANSYLGYGARVKTVSQTVSSANAILADPGNCQTNVSANLNYSPPTNRNAWGQYTATSTIQAVTCSFATTTFNGASTSIARCGGAYNVAGSTNRLTIWCNGYAPGHLAKSWSAEDCYGTGRYSCNVPTPAAYNGRTGLVQGIRDGNNSIVQWGAPTPAGGVRAIGNWESLTNINGGSTPYDHSYTANDKGKQVFYSDNTKFGQWTPGQTLAQNLAFYKAGDSGSPFSMTKLYRYDAQFLTGSAVINSYNITTGAVSTSPTQVWVPDTDVLCGPQSSPRIEVIRAIGELK